jgi:PAS domain S-box-containing protein
LGVPDRPDLLHHIINAVADPIFVKNEARRFVLVNDALCRLVGHSRDVLIGKGDDDFFPPAEAAVFRISTSNT